MLSAVSISTLGLALDCFGVVGLFFFGLPARLDRKGTQFIILEGGDRVEAARAANFDTMGGISLLLILIGFLLQIWSNYLPA